MEKNEDFHLGPKPRNLITKEAMQHSTAEGKTQGKIGLGGNQTNDSNHG